MTIIKALHIGWTKMSGTEKIKTVLKFISGVGCGFIGNDIARTFSAGKNPVEKICYSVAGFGLGGAMGTAAADSLCETVDDFVELNEMRKQMKQEREGNAHA